MSYTATRRALLALAAQQGGYFTAQQALSVGYAYPEQHYHVKEGNWLKTGRGVYRLAEYPVPPQAELIRLTLLSADRQGTPQAVVSHETALALHELGDANPARIHLTVPSRFRKRLPSEVRLYRRALGEGKWEEREGYRVTTPLQTLLDIAESAESWPLLEGAVRDALARGLVRKKRLLTAEVSEQAKARLKQAVEAVDDQERLLSGAGV
jgi:predicted transcriptional regulator of viral defense system